MVPPSEFSSVPIPGPHGLLTFLGLFRYLAPEVLLDDHGYSKLVDFWSLGVLLFEMCCGWSPFYAEDVQQMYKNICFGKIRFPRGVIGDDGKQFVKGVSQTPAHAEHPYETLLTDAQFSFSTETQSIVSVRNATLPSLKSTPSSSPSIGDCSLPSRSHLHSNRWSRATSRFPTLILCSRRLISGTYHSTGVLRTTR